MTHTSLKPHFKAGFNSHTGSMNSATGLLYSTLVLNTLYAGLIDWELTQSPALL
jgi:hypothetical protein